MDENVAALVEFFSHPADLESEVLESSYSPCPFANTPTNLLSQGNASLQQEGSQSGVNGLSFAKRALDCQLDWFLAGFELNGLAEKERWSTSKKIDLFGNLGLVPVNILHRINKVRNDIEHRYQNVSPAAAENALDVVELFLSATNRRVSHVPLKTEFRLRRNTRKAEQERVTTAWIVIEKGRGMVFDGVKGEFPSTGKPDYFAQGWLRSGPLYYYLLTIILHPEAFGSPDAADALNSIKYYRKYTAKLG